MRVKNGLLISVTMLSSVAAGPALAQDTGEAPARPDAERLGDIVVTAERRTARLQQTPLAVTALSEEQLQAHVVTDALDLGRQVPNLIASNNITLGGSNAYFLRGIGSVESLASFDPAVLTYVDEIVDPRQIANNVSLLDVERLEVLRGPQGTLFGRNTTGGAISITTRKPSDSFRVRAEATYGRFRETTVKGSVDLPVSEGIYTKFSGFFSDDEGWQRSVRTDELYNGKHAYGFRGALRLEPSDRIRWDLAADWQYMRKQTLQSIVDPAAADTNRSADSDGPWVLGSGNRNDVYLRNCTTGKTPFDWVRNGCVASEVEGYNIYSNIAIELSDATSINVITGYRNHDHRFVSPLYASLRTGFELPLSTQGNSKMFQQELKLSGSLMDGGLRYVTGLFYLKEDNFTDFETSATAPGIGVFAVIDRNTMENDARSFAWYGQADFAATDKLTLTAGLRYTDEKKTLPFYLHTNDAGVDFDLDDIIALGTPTRVVTRQWTPRFVAKYDFTDDLNVYVSATRGFKSGGWNGRATQARLMTYFGKETAWSYEAGLRAEWFDRRLRSNVTLFDVTYDDLQLPSLAFVPAPGDVPQFVTNNAGKLHVRGAEIELSALLARGFTVYTNLGFQDADYKSISAGAASAGILIGNEPQRAPARSVMAGAEYRTTVGKIGEMFANVDLQNSSHYYIDAQNSPSARTPAYSTVNASIGLDRPFWSIQFSCKNCFDKRYMTDQLLGARFINDPMRWLVTVRFKDL